MYVNVKTTGELEGLIHNGNIGTSIGAVYTLHSSVNISQPYNDNNNSSLKN